MPTYLGRYLNGTMSEKQINERIMMPPPPMPCTDRPASKMPMLCETEHRIVPMANKRIDANRHWGRPRMSLREAVKGMVTATVRR